VIASSQIKFLIEAFFEFAFFILLIFFIRVKNKKRIEEKGETAKSPLL
jgi:prolipoprotein diacylglyceryltransferase